MVKFLEVQRLKTVSAMGLMVVALAGGNSAYAHCLPDELSAEGGGPSCSSPSSSIEFSIFYSLDTNNYPRGREYSPDDLVSRNSTTMRVEQVIRERKYASSLPIDTISCAMQQPAEGQVGIGLLDGGQMENTISSGPAEVGLTFGADSTPYQDGDSVNSWWQTSVMVRAANGQERGCIRLSLFSNRNQFFEPVVVRDLFGGWQAYVPYRFPNRPHAPFGFVQSSDGFSESMYIRCYCNPDALPQP